MEYKLKIRLDPLYATVGDTTKKVAEGKEKTVTLDIITEQEIKRRLKSDPENETLLRIAEYIEKHEVYVELIDG
jgi:hypothetical protein